LNLPTSLPASSSKYVFVDWAGDPGFKFRRGSSQYLVMVAVFTRAYEVMQQRLDRLRNQRRLATDFHFHYADASKLIKPAFFDALVDVPFTARVMVVNKAELSDPWRRMRGQRMIEHFVAEAVVGAGRERVEKGVLIFDGPRRETKTIRGIRVAISRLFEKRELDYRLKKVTARPAAEEDGLQVADMIAGAALDEVTGGSHGYLARLGEKLEIIQVPEKENRPG